MRGFQIDAGPRTLPSAFRMLTIGLNREPQGTSSKVQRRFGHRSDGWEAILCPWLGEAFGVGDGISTRVDHTDDPPFLRLDGR